MKKIKLDGKNSIKTYTVVDDDLFAYLNQWRWHCDKQGYVVRTQYYKDIKGSKNIYMHRIINETPVAMETDHLNGDKADNRKSNLRTATRLQNAQNKGLTKSNKSGFKGVHWCQRAKKYIAKIKNDGRSIHLGTFSDKLEAARVYNEAAVKYHGDFADLNIVKWVY